MALAAFGCLSSGVAKNIRYEIASHKTGSGLYDRYNFGMLVGDEPAQYYVAVASWRKVDLKDLRVLDGNGAPLVVMESRRVTKNMATYDVVIVEFTRAPRSTTD